MEQTLHLRGVNFQVHWELEDVRKGRHAEWTGAARRARTRRPNTGSRPVDGGTRFAYRNEFKAPLGPLGAVASRALVGGLPRARGQGLVAQPEGARGARLTRLLALSFDGNAAMV